MTTNEAAVASVLAKYQEALNAADTDAVMPLYTADGIFMAPFSPSAIGHDSLRRAYDSVFEAIQLAVVFHVEEIVELSPEWVYARTNSLGTTLQHANGKVRPEANQELFLFHKVDGAWKIARYSFSSSKPPEASPRP